MIFFPFRIKILCYMTTQMFDFFKPTMDLSHHHLFSYIFNVKIVELDIYSRMRKKLDIRAHSY